MSRTAPVRLRCRDCGAPVDRRPAKSPGQPATGYCDCVRTSWVFQDERAPLKLFVRDDGGVPLEVQRGRAVVVTTDTSPPRRQASRASEPP